MFILTLTYVLIDNFLSLFVKRLMFLKLSDLRSYGQLLLMFVLTISVIHIMIYDIVNPRNIFF